MENQRKGTPKGVWLVVLCLMTLAAPAARAQESGPVYLLTVDDAITSATADYLSRGIAQAERERAHAVVIQLNTPGGAVDAMTEIVETLENARLPILVYVWPRGGMAASAGTMIALAASGAAMAPNTTIGAAHPVAGGPVNVPEYVIEKHTNLLAEHAGAFAARRGDDAVAWATPGFWTRSSSRSEGSGTIFGVPSTRTAT